jgi:hypothetical protein
VGAAIESKGHIFVDEQIAQEIIEGAHAGGLVRSRGKAMHWTSSQRFLDQPIRAGSRCH